MHTGKFLANRPILADQLSPLQTPFTMVHKTSYAPNRLSPHTGCRMLLPNSSSPPPAYDDITHRATIGADVTVSGVHGERSKFHLENLELPLTFEQLRQRIVEGGWTFIASCSPTY